jgi:hypothetical protein
MPWGTALAYTPATCAVSFLLTLAIAISESGFFKWPAAKILHFLRRPRIGGKSDAPA